MKRPEEIAKRVEPEHGLQPNSDCRYLLAYIESQAKELQLTRATLVTYRELSPSKQELASLTLEKADSFALEREKL